MDIRIAIQERDTVITLLQAEKLPVEDLPTTLENFVIAKQGDRMIGTIGLEIYGNYALLRSLVVDKKFRNQGIADQLLLDIESKARERNLQQIYLLTETAPIYFEKKGYQRISREEVPLEVQKSSEFSHVCPQSAVVMTKKLI